MTDELQQVASEPKAETPVVQPTPAAETPLTQPDTIPPAPKKSNKRPWIIAGAVVAVISLCSMVCLALVVAGVGKVFVERAPVESVLGAFMNAMEAKDIDSAYDLFSPRARRQMPVTDLQKLIQGNNYMIFEGYRSLTVQNLNLTAAANTNPDKPQGTVANVVATVYYEGGIQGTLTAVLEKADGVWRLYNFKVTVPPDKFQP